MIKQSSYLPDLFNFASGDWLDGIQPIIFLPVVVTADALSGENFILRVNV